MFPLNPCGLPHVFFALVVDRVGRRLAESERTEGKICESKFRLWRSVVVKILLVLMMFAAVGTAVGQGVVVPAKDRKAEEAVVFGRSRAEFEAIRRRDRAGAEALLAPDFVYLSAIARRDRNRTEEMDENWGVQLLSYEIEKPRAVWIDKKAVVIHYLVRMSLVWQGKEVCPHSGVTESWSKRGQSWLMVTRTEYLLGATTPPPCVEGY